MDEVRSCYEYHVFRAKRSASSLLYSCPAHENPVDKPRIMQMTRCPTNENRVFSPLWAPLTVAVFLRSNGGTVDYFLCVKHNSRATSYLFLFFSEIRSHENYRSLSLSYISTHSAVKLKNFWEANFILTELGGIIFIPDFNFEIYSGAIYIAKRICGRKINAEVNRYKTENRKRRAENSGKQSTKKRVK